MREQGTGSSEATPDCRPAVPMNLQGAKRRFASCHEWPTSRRSGDGAIRVTACPSPVVVESQLAPIFEAVLHLPD